MNYLVILIMLCIKKRKKKQRKVLKLKIQSLLKQRPNKIHREYLNKNYDIAKNNSKQNRNSITQIINNAMPNLSPNSINNNDNDNETEEEDEEDDEKEFITFLDRLKMEREVKERVLLRDKEIKDAEHTKMDVMKKLKEREKEQEKRRMMLKLRDEENKNKVGLIDIVNKKNVNVNRKSNNKLESEFAKILVNSGDVFVDGNVDDEIVCDESGGDTEFLEEQYSTFLPPKNQTGNGKTWLNEKLGY
eukprot:167131_1